MWDGKQGSNQETPAKVQERNDGSLDSSGDQRDGRK